VKKIGFSHFICDVLLCMPLDLCAAGLRDVHLRSLVSFVRSLGGRAHNFPIAGPNPNPSHFLLLGRQGFGLPPPVGLSGLVLVSFSRRCASVWFWVAALVSVRIYGQERAGRSVVDSFAAGQSRVELCLLHPDLVSILASGLRSAHSPGPIARSADSFPCQFCLPLPLVDSAPRAPSARARLLFFSRDSSAPVPARFSFSCSKVSLLRARVCRPVSSVKDSPPVSSVGSEFLCSCSFGTSPVVFDAFALFV
jgi:hypothetical protein